jgi:hypothetical protein
MGDVTYTWIIKKWKFNKPSSFLTVYTLDERVLENRPFMGHPTEPG